MRKVASRRSVRLLVGVWASITLYTVIAGAAEFQRRPLRVALYPYVPLKSEMYWKLEQAFEDKFPRIDLRFVD